MAKARKSWEEEEVQLQPHSKHRLGVRGVDCSEPVALRDSSVSVNRQILRSTYLDTAKERKDWREGLSLPVICQ